MEVKKSWRKNKVQGQIKELKKSIYEYIVKAYNAYKKILWKKVHFLTKLNILKFRKNKFLTKLNKNNAIQ